MGPSTSTSAASKRARTQTNFHGHEREAVAKVKQPPVFPALAHPIGSPPAEGTLSRHGRPSCIPRMNASEDTASQQSPDDHPTRSLDIVGFLNQEEINDLFSHCISMRRGVWSPSEDDMLRRVMNHKHGHTWEWVGKHLLGRSGKQCRERWVNYLDPSLARTQMNKQEKSALAHIIRRYGRSWTQITKRLNLWRSRLNLPGTRGPNEVKNMSNSAQLEDIFSAPSSGSSADPNDGTEAGRYRHDQSVDTERGRITWRVVSKVPPTHPIGKTTVFMLHPRASNDYARFNRVLNSPRKKFTRRVHHPA